MATPPNVLAFTMTLPPAKVADMTLPINGIQQRPAIRASVCCILRSQVQVQMSTIELS